jgi:hypothetical protein
VTAWAFCLGGREGLARRDSRIHLLGERSHFREYVRQPESDTIHLYYGVADANIALATGSVRAMLKWLEQHS